MLDEEHARDHHNFKDPLKKQSEEGLGRMTF